MDFSFFCLGLAFFGGIWVLHVIVWRIFKPKGEIKPLFLLFFGLPGLVGLFIWQVYPILDPIDLALASMVHLSISVAYIQTYPAISTVIPSFRVLQLVHHAGPQGLKAEDILKEFGTEEMVGSRVELMLEDSLIIKDESGQLSLSSTGNLIASTFLAYRALLGLEVGKG